MELFEETKFRVRTLELLFNNHITLKKIDEPQYCFWLLMNLFILSRINTVWLFFFNQFWQILSSYLAGNHQTTLATLLRASIGAPVTGACRSICISYKSECKIFLSLILNIYLFSAKHLCDAVMFHSIFCS